jgi:hypothetical protein
MIKLLSEIPLRARRPFRGVEVGVAVGMLSKVLLSTYPNLQLWMVDAWRPPPEDSPYRRTNDMRSKLTDKQQEGRYLGPIRELADHYFGRAIPCRGNSTEWADFARRLGLSFSFVFIDGDHSREGVWADVNAWWPLVKPGGIFCGHDYGSLKYSGVKQSVDEFAAEKGIDICQCTGLSEHVWYHFKE